MASKKPKAGTSSSSNTAHRKSHTKHKPSWCRYCTAKLPHYMTFCNREHRAAIAS